MQKINAEKRDEISDEMVIGLRKIARASIFQSHYIGNVVVELRSKLKDLPEMRYEIFWRSIEIDRQCHGDSTEPPIGSEWSDLQGVYSLFDSNDYHYVLNCICAKELRYDKLIVTKVACSLIAKFNLSDSSINELRVMVKEDVRLNRYLDYFISSKNSKKHASFDNRTAKRRKKDERKEMIEKEYRHRWIIKVKNNPELIFPINPHVNGNMTPDQIRIMSLDEHNNSRGGWHGDWNNITKIFGFDVVKKYKDAAIRHWRHYIPTLPSECSEKSSLPSELIFGLVGLEIEYSNNPEFLIGLSDVDFRTVMHYSFWEANGFPTWFTKAYESRRDIFMELILRELDYELQDKNSDYTLLCNLTYRTPWTHKDIADFVIESLEKNDWYSINTLEILFHILRNCSDKDRLLKITMNKYSRAIGLNKKAKFLAFWVDLSADSGIPELKNWLQSLSVNEASLAAQKIACDLFGEKIGRLLGFNFCTYRSVDHLKDLCLIMNEYIPVERDIDRAGTIYTPELRDEARSARDKILWDLSEIPGKSTYLALLELSKILPSLSARNNAKSKAIVRAEQDGDHEFWTLKQFQDFETDLTLTPQTSEQLFGIVVSKLEDMRNELEFGDDSPYKVWKDASDEEKIRILVDQWLTFNANDRFKCNQEKWLSSTHRVDIYVQSKDEKSCVPIEIKLPEKWSGPKLCEGLENQLAGNYLREHGFGVFLLPWRGGGTRSTWKISGKIVPIDCLERALQDYWSSIQSNYPHVVDIKVIVIDLTKRGIKS